MNCWDYQWNRSYLGTSMGFSGSFVGQGLLWAKMSRFPLNKGQYPFRRSDLHVLPSDTCNFNWSYELNQESQSYFSNCENKSSKSTRLYPFNMELSQAEKSQFPCASIERYHTENVVVFTSPSSAIRGRTASQFLSGPQRPYLSEDTASPATTTESGLSHLRGHSWGITFHAGQPQESAHQSGLLGDGQGFHALTRTIHRWFLSGTALPGMQERPWLGLLH